MTPEQLTEKLKVACGDRLKSVVLYGSAAAGDHAGKRSDYNILVVLDRLGLEELRGLSKPARQWVKAGNPVPLFFTKERLAQSVDVFPIEIADIRESHRILFGDDVVSNLPVHKENLRLELEHELKGKLIQLRERFILTDGNSGQTRELLINSLSTFLVLFRAALRLYQDVIPARKIEALQELSHHIQFDTDVFKRVAEMKEKKAVKGTSPETLFKAYLEAVETVVDSVDSFLHKKD